MKKLLLLVTFVLACGGSQENQPESQTNTSKAQTDSSVDVGEGEPLEVPSDASAQYFVIARGGTPERPTITTKRIGSSGTSFSLREYDCRAQTFRYLGEGETLEEMNSSTPDPNMGPIVSASISDYVGRAACAGSQGTSN